MKTLKIKLGLLSLLAILAASVFLTSCEQQEILQVQDELIEANIEASETVETSSTAPKVVVEHVQIFEGNDLLDYYPVVIGTSPLVYKLSKQHPQAANFFQLIQDSNRDNAIKPLKIKADESTTFVSDVVEATAEEEIKWKSLMQEEVWEEENLSIDGEESIEHRYSTSFSDYNAIRDAFNTMNSYRCSPYGPNPEHCISFNYKRDGCHARAHRMRQLLESEYGKTCRKLFVYGNINAGGLSVPGCNYGWNYHVAPMVKAENTGTWYIIDPSLANEPITVDAWKSLMGGNSRVCRTDDKNNDVYKPNRVSGCRWHWYFMDSHYHYTYAELAEYERKSGC